MTAVTTPPTADGFPMFSEDLVERLVQQRRAAASIEAECTALVAEMIRRDIHDDQRRYCGGRHWAKLHRGEHR